MKLPPSGAHVSSFGYALHAIPYFIMHHSFHERATPVSRQMHFSLNIRRRLTFILFSVDADAAQAAPFTDPPFSRVRDMPDA